MYARRPASRAARGTPTVAAAGFTPVVVVRGSCQLAIVTPLARAKGPFASGNISWIAGPSSRETGHGIGALPLGRLSDTLARLGREGALFQRIIRLAALWLAICAFAAAPAAAQPR